ncbi:DUF6879 family protein [Microtetraspora sp. NBRC 16547]|uniref:DUF6879 family protein n=1 Tax=Microtetraspora sp. NBRC 16547 TaxID=3030993 RepID=UPI0024A5EE87|nr:DUF6879 family protein [Microtetraspora sp. NBRC 16547]GLW97649.1 hypothetical protein Misp02_17360 [Microtetraspora sp. NBRC 16547]
MDFVDIVRNASAQTLSVEVYQAEFAEVYASVTEPAIKLERAQHFDEEDFPSWVALLEGDWDRSLALLRESRESLTEYFDRHAEFRRVRIVESPLTPYMRWELHSFVERVAAGERIRVLPGSEVAEMECSGPLPELVILRPDRMYEVLYDERGVHTGARRISEPDVVRHARAVLQSLYDRSEDLTTFFTREVAPATTSLSGPAWSSR